MLVELTKCATRHDRNLDRLIGPKDRERVSRSCARSPRRSAGKPRGQRRDQERGRRIAKTGPKNSTSLQTSATHFRRQQHRLDLVRIGRIAADPHAGLEAFDRQRAVLGQLVVDVEAGAAQFADRALDHDIVAEPGRDREFGPPCRPSDSRRSRSASETETWSWPSARSNSAVVEASKISK